MPLTSDGSVTRHFVDEPVTREFEMITDADDATRFYLSEAGIRFAGSTSRCSCAVLSIRTMPRWVSSDHRHIAAMSSGKVGNSSRADATVSAAERSRPGAYRSAMARNTSCG